MLQKPLSWVFSLYSLKLCVKFYMCILPGIGVGRIYTSAKGFLTQKSFEWLPKARLDRGCRFAQQMRRLEPGSLARIVFWHLGMDKGIRGPVIIIILQNFLTISKYWATFSSMKNYIPLWPFCLKQIVLPYRYASSSVVFFSLKASCISPFLWICSKTSSGCLRLNSTEPYM